MQSLRERGVRPEALVGYLGYALGLIPEPLPCTPADLVPHFAWEHINKDPWRLPEDLAAVLLRE